MTSAEHETIFGEASHATSTDRSDAALSNVAAVAYCLKVYRVPEAESEQVLRLERRHALAGCTASQPCRA
jgi:hypothetical protein